MKVNSLRKKDLNKYKTPKFFIYVFYDNGHSSAVVYRMKDLKANFGKYQVNQIIQHYSSVSIVLEEKKHE